MICSMFKQVNNWSGEDSTKGRGWGGWAGDQGQVMGSLVVSSQIQIQISEWIKTGTEGFAYLWREV